MIIKEIHIFKTVTEFYLKIIQFCHLGTRFSRKAFIFKQAAKFPGFQLATGFSSK